MKNLNEEKLSDVIVIDLTSAKENMLNEVYYESFGGQVALALEKILSGAAGTLQIKGTPNEIGAFAGTIAQEARYLKTASSLGLNNPSTWNDAARLNRAIMAFQNQTGLRWPIG